MSTSAVEAHTVAQPVASRALVTVSIMLATIMQALDTTIANVALPDMQGAMSATQDQIAWVLTSYIVAAAIMTPLTGVLAARLGRKRVFLVSVVGFTISSMLCGASTSLGEIVLFRLLQGVFGAALVPLSQAVLLDTYPREQHGQAMAIWGMGVVLGPILGPTLGGFLTEYYNWRYAFYINFPVGVLAFLGILATVPENKRDNGRGFDYFGFALLSLAIGCLQLMLDRGQSLDWFSSPEIIFETVGAGLFFYMFVVHMLCAENPFIEADLFKDRNFVFGQIFIFVLGTAIYATLALLPPYMQQLMGYPVLLTGFVLAPRGIGAMAGMFLVGRLAGRIDTRYFIFCGLLLTAVAMHIMSRFNLDTGVASLVFASFVQGIGSGSVFVSLSTITFATLPMHLRNEGTAMFSLIRNIGSSIGISIVMTLLARNIQINHAGLATTLNPFRAAVSPGALPHIWNWTTTAGVAALNAEVNRQAAMIGYIDDFVFIMWIVIASLPFVFLLKRDAKRK